MPCAGTIRGLSTLSARDILTKVDRAAMAVSLEVRVPMLDHEFIAWAGSLPRDLKLRGTESKYILKRALEPRVPRENLYRSKTGFATPLRDFFRGSGAQIARDAILSPEMTDSGLFDLEVLKSLLSSHERKSATTARRYGRW